MPTARKYYPGMGTGKAETKWLDDEDLEFGDSSDVIARWSSTSSVLEFLPATDDQGAVHIGNGTKDVDFKVFLGSTAKYFLCDVGNARAQLPDSTPLVFGDLADAALQWDGANLTLKPVADDTGAFVIGDGTTDMDLQVVLGDAADYMVADVGAKALILAGAARLRLDGVSASGVTDGSVIRMGTSGSPLVDDQAGAGFVVGYFDCGAASGWPAGLYLSADVTGAGGSFTALEGDPVIKAAKAVVTGIESFMQFVSPGKVTGAARACQATVDFGNYQITAGGGVYSAACFNIKGEGAACDPSLAQRISCLELKTEGTFEANKDFEKKAAGYAIYFNGFTAAAGVTNILSSTSLAELPAGTLGLRVGVGGDGAAGDAYYIPLVAAAEWN